MENPKITIQNQNHMRIWKEKKDFKKLKGLSEENIYIYQEERLTRIIFYTKKDVSFRRNTHHGFRGREKKQSQICAPVITNKLE